MNLQIVTTPKTILITDANDNKILIVKTQDGFEFHSTVNQTRLNKVIIGIQKTIKNILTSPTNNRDNYRVRFDKLGKQLSEVKTHSFITIKNVLVKDEICV